MGRRRRAPYGMDELGDTVEPLLIGVVDGAVTQELVRRDERGPCLHGRAVRMGRRTSRVSDGAAVQPSYHTEGCSKDACCSFPTGPVAALAAGDGERRGGPPMGAV